MAEEAHPAIAGREQAALHIVVELGEAAAVERELEPLLGAEQRALGAALLRDVAPDAAVAEEAAVLAMAHQPGDDVHLARAARVGARDLDVERRLLFEVVLQRRERRRLDFHAGDFPEALAVGQRLAEEGGDRAPARQPADAVLGVGLPEPVGGELGQGAEARMILLRLGERMDLPAREQVHDEVHRAARKRHQQRDVEHGRLIAPRRAPAARP